jgi:hypothetical protein
VLPPWRAPSPFIQHLNSSSFSKSVFPLLFPISQNGDTSHSVESPSQKSQIPSSSSPYPISNFVNSSSPSLSHLCPFSLDGDYLPSFLSLGPLLTIVTYNLSTVSPCFLNKGKNSISDYAKLDRSDITLLTSLILASASQFQWLWNTWCCSRRSLLFFYALAYILFLLTWWYFLSRITLKTQLKRSFSLGRFPSLL